MNKAILLIIGAAVVLFGGILLLAREDTDPMEELSASFGADESEVISESGIHWHPELTILIKRQKQEIPADVGIGVQYRDNRWFDPMMQMTDIHTHDNSGTLHWEVMSGPVKKGHVKLGAFFEIWGKPFNTTQLFEYKNGESGTLTMLVNGQPNTAFETYVVKDGDKIEIRY